MSTSRIAPSPAHYEKAEDFIVSWSRFTEGKPLLAPTAGYRAHPDCCALISGLEDKILKWVAAGRHPAFDRLNHIFDWIGCQGLESRFCKRKTRFRGMAASLRSFRLGEPQPAASAGIQISSGHTFYVEFGAQIIPPRYSYPQIEYMGYLGELLPLAAQLKGGPEELARMYAWIKAHADLLQQFGWPCLSLGARRIMYVRWEKYYSENKRVLDILASRAGVVRQGEQVCN